MKPRLALLKPHVQKLYAKSTDTHGDAGSATVLDQANAGGEGNARFREAVPDYRTLLSHGREVTLDSGLATSFERWSDRWSRRELRSLRATELDDYFAELAQRGFATKDIEREKSLLRSFYRWALRCGWTDQDPSLNLAPTRSTVEPPPVAWTGVEQTRLLEACRQEPKGEDGRREERVEPLHAPHRKSGKEKPSGDGRMGSPPHAGSLGYLHDLVLTGLRTGLRLGDLILLQWRHVDLRRQRIVIPRSEVPSAHGVDVALSADVAELFRALASAHEDIEPTGRVFEAAGLPLWRGRPDEGAVLMAFRRARRKAGIVEGDFNSLRLTYLRNCARAGIPMEHAALSCDWEGPLDELTQVWESWMPPVRPETAGKSAAVA